MASVSSVISNATSASDAAQQATGEKAKTTSDLISDFEDSCESLMESAILFEEYYEKYSISKGADVAGLKKKMKEKVARGIVE